MGKLIQHSLIILVLVLTISIQAKADFAEGLYQANLFYIQTVNSNLNSDCSALDSTQVNFYLGKDARANSFKAYPVQGQASAVRAKITNNKLVVAYNDSLAPYVDGRIKISAKVINNNELAIKAVVKSGSCKFSYVGSGSFISK